MITESNPIGLLDSVRIFSWRIGESIKYSHSMFNTHDSLTEKIPGPTIVFHLIGHQRFIFTSSRADFIRRFRIVCFFGQPGHVG